MDMNANAIITKEAEGEVIPNGFPKTKWNLAENAEELSQVAVCTLGLMMEFIVPKIAPPTPNANTAGTIFTIMENPCAMIDAIIPCVVAPKTTLRTMKTSVPIVRQTMTQTKKNDRILY